MRKITVSDVTLKAVEEKELNLTFREKLAIAEKIDAIGVDAIELPLLRESKENEVIYRTIASSIKNAMVKIPVGEGVQSLNSVLQCVKDAKKVCLQVVLPISTSQMEYFYHVKAPAMIQKIDQAIKSAKQACDCVEFVVCDAFRAEEGFLIESVKTAVNAGACAVTICDDAGVAFPEDFEKSIKEIKDVCDVKVYVQPSDELNLASACALSAIKAGADGVKTTLAVKYVSASVLADVIRAKKYDLGVDCAIDVTNVKSISDAINSVVNGEIEKEAEQKVAKGNIDGNTSIKDISEIIKQLGYELSDADLGNVYEEFKKLSTKKEVIDMKELEALIASTAMQVPSTYHLVNYVVNSGNIIPATANVTLEKDGEKFTGVSTGDGPIDAAFHAIEQVIGHHYELDDFQVHAVTKGRGAVGSSIIRLRADGKLYPGNGVSTDIVGACIRAYINALNKIVYEEN
ncbi:MAG: hypothetical protein IKB67_00415 [Clostridia bacterium]|nr:hypothetical protein [Clostridia bacterium]